MSLGGSPQQQQQMMMMGGAPPGIEATTTIGAKYEFRQSVFRGQIDSQGKVSCLLERRVLPVVSVIFAGEIDHAKSAARLGLGLQFEAGGEDLYTQTEQTQAPPPQPHPPM
jgi:mitochondrial import receptor subunit TOM40